jgi:death-on-curing protein
LPKSNHQIYRLSAALIESAHDFGIGVVWPGIEPVEQASCLDLNLLQSAARQPYQVVFGRELYPTLAAKAAYLFVHIASGHIFSNGNKRTAALCLDTFLLVNSKYLTLSNDEVHDLAQSVASFGERRERFSDVLERTTTIIERNMISLSVFRQIDMSSYRALHKRKNMFRHLDINQPDAPPVQRR